MIQIRNINQTMKKYKKMKKNEGGTFYVIWNHGAQKKVECRKFKVDGKWKVQNL
jgi:hypothetical protein